jgi:hypothetical protein
MPSIDYLKPVYIEKQEITNIHEMINIKQGYTRPNDSR